MAVELFFSMSILAASLLNDHAFAALAKPMTKLNLTSTRTQKVTRFLTDDRAEKSFLLVGVPFLLTYQCARHLCRCIQGFADTLPTSTVQKPCKTLGSKQT